MQWKPNVTVAAIIEQDTKFLLVEESIGGRIVFNQPAGHLEENETLIEAVKREVIEETTWEFMPEFIIGLYLYYSQSVTYLRVCFCGKLGRHFSERQPDVGIIQTQWLSRTAIEKNKVKLRSPLVLQCVDDYLAGKRYPLALLNHYLSGND